MTHRRQSSGSQIRTKCRWTATLGYQCEGHQGVLGAGAGGYDNELPPRTCAIGHRDAATCVWSFSPPEFPARLAVEGVKVAIAATDEHQAASGHHRPTPAGRAEAIREDDAFQQRMVSYRRAAFPEWRL